MRLTLSPPLRVLVHRESGGVHGPHVSVAREQRYPRDQWP